MLKCLYYLGRTICCFDDEALGNTWCFSICCLSGDCILWKDFLLSYDLYSHWENLYHLYRHMIYIPVWGICIILLVVWFLFPFGEFVSFCPSHDLYSHWENLYHLACRVIYIPTWGFYIILFLVWFIFPLGESVSFFARKIP